MFIGSSRSTAANSLYTLRIFLLLCAFSLIPLIAAQGQEPTADEETAADEEPSVEEEPGADEEPGAEPVGTGTGSKRGAVIPIEGEIDKFQVVFLRRSIEKARDSEADTIIFTINTFGGRVDSALQMATLIGSLDDIHTVAYIPAEPESLGVSWSAGALISLSSNAIYMAPGTSIGAAAPVLQSSEGAKAAGEKTVSAVRAQMAALAEKNGYPREIAIAMVDMDTELIEIRENGSYRFELAETAGGGSGGSGDGEAEDADAEGGEAEQAGEPAEDEAGGPRRRVISPKGKLLTLTAGQMEEYGISSGTVSKVDDLLSRLGIGSSIKVSPTEADQIVGFLTSAAVTRDRKSVV